MNNIAAAELLDIWEQGLYQPPLQRIFILLVATFPDKTPAELLELSIGQRDVLLLRLREHLFGQRLLNTARCLQCGERIEWESSVADYFVQATELAESFELREADYMLRFRLPNSLDVAAAVNAGDTDIILIRCVLHAEQNGEECATEKLPDFVLQKLAEKIEEADPLAEIRLQLNCPACADDWEVVFDIASFLWAELNDWAERMLRTIHKLAAGYGWSEQDILALSPVRRQLYSGMLGW